jgi:hypothetical protein
MILKKYDDKFSSGYLLDNNPSGYNLHNHDNKMCCFYDTYLHVAIFSYTSDIRISDFRYHSVKNNEYSYYLEFLGDMFISIRNRVQ